MFLQQPNESPYDLRFNLLGFSSRISWTFWLVAVVLGYQFVQFTDRVYQPTGTSPGAFVLLIVWVACMAASILIHELGHAIAFRRYGIDSMIVLYYLGGLAIPMTSFRGSRSFRSMGSRQDLIVAAAGPVFQIGSALLVVIVAWMFGYETSSLSMMPRVIADLNPLVGGREFENAMTYALVNFYVWPSVLWGLLNLLPVLPLDGGRIAKAIIELQGGDVVTALWISVITAALISLYGFNTQNHFLGLLFASLAINNYQSIQPGGRW
jgi:stage IV sporulation protein FB